jgi:hypothetical protein
MGLFSALGNVYKAVRQALTRTGVYVGETADYPRVEIHSITESEWLDKGSLKTVSCIVECISDKRIADVIEMNAENLRRMLESQLNLDKEWKVVGVIPGQLQSLTETTETKEILYRLLQNITIYVERYN